MTQQATPSTTRILAIATVAGAAILMPACHTGARGPAARLTSAQRAEYVVALDGMMESDQRHRAAISWGTTDPDELARLSALPDDEVLPEISRWAEAGIEL